MTPAQPSGATLAGAPVGLEGIRDEAGRYIVLACDHRDSLRLFLSPDDPDGVSADELSGIKVDLARIVSPFASGMLLDPEYGIDAVRAAAVLAPGVGVVAALESQGYLADPITTITTVMDGWSAQQAAAAGASTAKVLLPYHPRRATASAQEQVVRDVMASCRAAGLPLVLEPVAFVLEDGDDHTDVVIDSLRRLDPLLGEPSEGLFKVPFPALGDDQAVWAQACRRVSETIERDWVVLSGGGDFARFADQLGVAMGNGCSGFMVGRALWGEAVRAPHDQRESLLAGQVVERFQELAAIAHG